MNKLIVILIGCIAIVNSYSMIKGKQEVDVIQSENISDWDYFKEEHSKQYNDIEEDDHRRKIFLENKRIIDQHNELFKAGKVSFEMGLNDLSDLTHEEYLNRLNGFKYDPTVTAEQNLIYNASSEWSDLQESVDWREKGVVTEVKNQGLCGSCWAFAATGALEGQHFRTTRKLVSLSEQNLVDCSGDYGNEGCNGGMPSKAFIYIKENEGIDTENSYPYKAFDGECKYREQELGATDNGFVSIAQGDEQALTEAIAKIGPIAVAIDSRYKSFHHYSGGIYREPDCSQIHLTHAVLAVGYGTDESGKNYYIIKNSWGKSWGEGGYIKMARGENNMCGIATVAAYPLV